MPNQVKLHDIVLYDVDEIEIQRDKDGATYLICRTGSGGKGGTCISCFPSNGKDRINVKEVVPSQEDA